jgi:hypothetical protein
MLAPISLGLIGPMGFLLAISILGHRKPKAPPKPSSDSLVINKTISEEKARSQQDELRVLTVRLGALRSLIGKLKASHEQGSITDGEFNALAQRHVDEMRQLEQDIIRRRLVVELFELERIEEKLAKAFTTKINELNETILLIRSKLGVEVEGLEFTVVPPVQEAPMGAGQASTTSDQPRTTPTEVRAPVEADVHMAPGATAPTSPHPSASKPITSSSAVEPKPATPAESKPKPQPGKRDGDGDESKENNVEEELSRIKIDVEKLLDELEQMEQNRG